MRVHARRSLATLAVAVLLAACETAPPASPATIAVATVRPSFETPGLPSGHTPEEIRAAVEPLLGKGVIAVGEGANRVIRITLLANAEAIARELNGRYGAAVALTVGNFPYPPPDAPQRACVQRPETVADHRPLLGTLAVDGTVVAGAFFKGKLRFRNAGTTPYQLETSSGFSVYLFLPGETLPIGSSEGAIAGTGFSKLLDPGAAVDLGTAGGTASCDLALGYVLPEGTYQARAFVDYNEPETFELHFFWSEPTLIEVVSP